MLWAVRREGGHHGAGALKGPVRCNAVVLQTSTCVPLLSLEVYMPPTEMGASWFHRPVEPLSVVRS